VFVEGAATAREQEHMLAHLGECAECRKAVFLMQPHEETQRAAVMPEKRWMRRWLVPVGLPTAALACALIVAVMYIRPRGAARETPQQMASEREPENERSTTTVAPVTNAESSRILPSGNAEQGATNAAGDVPRQVNPIAGSLRPPASNKGQMIAGAVPQKPVAAPDPSASATAADSSVAQNTIINGAISELPLNGRNVTDLQQLHAGQGAAAQNKLARKELPALQIQGASVQALAGISGRITDRSGATIGGVTVTLRDASGKMRQATSGADGSFHLTDLPAGQYELTATAAGFKTSQQSIELKPSEMAMLQPALDVGETSEVVEVEAANGATSVATESANVGQVVTEMAGVHRAVALPSALPVQGTVSQGKRVLSLDDAGNLFLSRNEGKKWKKVKPQWVGKAVRIELAQPPSGDAAANAKDVTAGPSEGAVFQLTTDAGAAWISKDAAHWHQR
jgi:hypothetical protein